MEEIWILRQIFRSFFVFFENILGLLKKVVPLSQYNQYTNLNKYK